MKIRFSFRLLFASVLILVIIITAASAQDSLNVSMIARIDYSGTWTYSPYRSAISGDYLFVAVGENGLFTLNISNPSQLEVVGWAPCPDYAFDVAVVGNLAFVADEALLCLDISDPVAPIQLDYINYQEFGHAVRSVAIQGNYAYAAGISDLWIIDISNPTDLVIVGNLDIGLDYVYTISVQGDYVYAAGGYGGVKVINISYPTQPTIVWSAAISYTTGMQVVNDNLYLFGEPGMNIFSLENPAQPQFINTYNPLELCDGFVVGDIVHLTAGSNGLRIMNITNPAFPFEIGHCTDDDLYAWRVTVAQGNAFVSSINWSIWNYYNGIMAIDVNSSFYPQIVGECNSLGKCHEVTVNGTYAYITPGESEFTILNISDPSNPTIVGEMNGMWGHTMDIAISGNYAYLINGAAGLYKISIYPPTQPYIVTHTTGSGLMNSLAIAGAYTYIAGFNPDFRILLNSSQQTCSLSLPGSPGRIALQDSIALVTCGDSGIVVIDVSDPANATILSTLSTSGPAIDIVWGDNNLSYATIGNGCGLVVFDMTNPSSPTQAGIYPLTRVGRISISGDIAFVTDNEIGLIVLDISNPELPQLIGYYNTLGIARDVAGYGQYAILADYTSFSVLQLNISSVIDHIIPIPTLFYLSQPFPNPFNPSTVISYQLPVAGPVSLRVYDLSGRLVSTLTDGFKTPGYYEATFDGSSLASGLYFVRMQVGDFSAVQKMMLLK
jgi:hypothetical protein